jgi:hypothetical protein
LQQELQKSPAGTRQTDGKNLVWLREKERKLAKLSKTTFPYQRNDVIILCHQNLDLSVCEGVPGEGVGEAEEDCDEDSEAEAGGRHDGQQQEQHLRWNS